MQIFRFPILILTLSLLPSGMLFAEPPGPDQPEKIYQTGANLLKNMQNWSAELSAGQYKKSPIYRYIENGNRRLQIKRRRPFQYVYTEGEYRLHLQAHNGMLNYLVFHTDKLQYAYIYYPRIQLRTHRFYFGSKSRYLDFVEMAGRSFLIFSDQLNRELFQTGNKPASYRNPYYKLIAQSFPGQTQARWFAAARNANIALDNPAELSLFAHNRIRKSIGLDPLILNSALIKAQQNHTQYLARNWLRYPNTSQKKIQKNLNGNIDGLTFLHFENPRWPGFTGRRPADRVRATGYNKPARENGTIGPGKNALMGTLEYLDSVYHRHDIMDSRAVAYGAAVFWGKGRIPSNTFALYGFDREKKDNKIYSYPFDGQENFPTTWNNMESPRPLPGGMRRVGMPLSIHCTDDSRLDVNIRLLDHEDRKIDLIKVTKKSSRYFRDFVPRKPLLPDQNYQLEIGDTTIEFHTRPLSRWTRRADALQKILKNFSTRHIDS